MGTINEPDAYSFDQLTPDSINEPYNVKNQVYEPKINNTQPKNGVATGDDIDLTLLGVGFLAQSVIFIDGAHRPTKLVSTNKVSTTVSATQPQILKCQVKNGNFASNIVDFDMKVPTTRGD